MFADQRCRLTGQYFVVPITSGIRSRHYTDREEGSRCATLGAVTVRQGAQLSTRVRHAIQEVFRRYDEDMDQFLNLTELSNCHEFMLGQPLVSGWVGVHLDHESAAVV
jgi:hypothetical protein